MTPGFDRRIAEAEQVFEALHQHRLQVDAD